MTKYVGYVFIFLAIAIVLYVGYMNSRFNTVTRTFSPYTLITSSWEVYKDKFMTKDGRVIDKAQGDITTSEGQSYALLRAVWVDDKDTFDTVWKWTKTNLKHSDNSLFGWRWGKLENKSYGFLPGGGENSASDADADIALALILASRRWEQKEYEVEAKNILKDMWERETATASNQRYLIAGEWANRNDTIIVNPSYFAPYAWRIFAKVDTDHDWQSLISPAYELLNRSGKESLNNKKGIGLPPNWVEISKIDGSLSVPSIQGLTTDYSYDAIRTPWRIALDYIWNKNPEAQNYLQSSYSHLRDEFKKNNKLVSSYAHDGKGLTNYESPSMYATLLGYFLVTDKETARTIYEDKIIKLYSNTENSFKDIIPYYEQNWLWFGAAMYNNFLENFSS